MTSDKVKTIIIITLLLIKLYLLLDLRLEIVYKKLFTNK